MFGGVGKRSRALWERLLNEHTDPPRLALAVSWGVFVGVFPIYGFQTAVCVATSRLFGLNTVAVVGAAQISNPLFAPILIGGGIALGDLVRFGALRWPELGEVRHVADGLRGAGGALSDRFVSCVVGDVLIGLVLGVVFGLATWRVATARRALADASDQRT